MGNASSRRHTVLVVDDSPLFRRVVCDTLAETPDLLVAGEAADGLEALHQVRELNPDLVTLDLDMPSMGGLEALSCIMRESPRPVIVLSGHAPPYGGDLTIRALELGAVDFVRKPSWADALDVETLRRRLVQALRAAAGGRVQALEETGGGASALPTRSGSPVSPSLGVAPATRVIGIASSTGGPRTLTELVPRIPGDVDAAIVIVQHMPAGFTASLARRLHDLGPRPVEECRHGATLLAGHVYVAPGGMHTVAATGDGDARVFRLEDSAPVHGVRPAADVTFASLASAFGAATTVVVLTGMGRDGATGAAAVKAAGGWVLVQDPDTCVVGGMGQAVLAAGDADEVLVPAALPEALRRLCAKSPAGQ